MASYTTNLNLKKPAGGENVLIGDINGNMDTIDAKVGGVTMGTTATTLTGAIAELSDQMATKGTFEAIKQNITSDGNVTVNLSSFRYILFLYYVGLHHRQTAFYPVAYLAGSGRCGFDNLNNSSRCYCLKQSYNASTHVMEYLTSIPSSGDWAGGYFDIIGIK